MEKLSDCCNAPIGFEAGGDNIFEHTGDFCIKCGVEICEDERAGRELTPTEKVKVLQDFMKDIWGDNSFMYSDHCIIVSKGAYTLWHDVEEEIAKNDDLQQFYIDSLINKPPKGYLSLLKADMKTRVDSFLEAFQKLK